MQIVGYLESILSKYHNLAFLTFMFFSSYFSDVLGPHIGSLSSLVWPLPHPAVSWGHGKAALQWTKGSCLLPYVSWQKLCHSHLLSSQFTVTHNQGYCIHCHTVIRDEIRKDRYSPCL